MMGSLRAGTHNFRFSFVRAKTNRLVRIPYLPWTMYDLDGGKEFPSTRDAVGIMTFNPTGISASCSGGVCRANAARREYPFPRNFDRLSRRSKMAAVTFLFRNKASFLMRYKTTYPHRVFIFKGSMTAMKPRVRLPAAVGRRRARPVRVQRRRRARRTRTPTKKYIRRNPSARIRTQRRRRRASNRVQKKWIWHQTQRRSNGLFRLKCLYVRRGNRRWRRVRCYWTCIRGSCRHSPKGNHRGHRRRHGGFGHNSQQSSGRTCKR